MLWLQEKGTPNMAFVHLIAMKFWHGAYGASIGSTLFYYVTYVLRLGGWERMQVIVVGGLIAGVTEVALSLALHSASWSVWTLRNLIYMRVFSEGDGRRVD